MNDTQILEFDVHLASGGRRIRLEEGAQPEAPLRVGRIPRVARLVALALKLEGMLARGELKDLAEIARVGRITRARATQIMDLALLAPDIIQAVLDLPTVVSGSDPVSERDLRIVAHEPHWCAQRRRWARLIAESE